MINLALQTSTKGVKDYYLGLAEFTRSVSLMKWLYQPHFRDSQASDDKKCKNNRWLTLVVAVTVFPLLVASVAFPLITGLPDVCMKIDMAMIELYTRNAMQGNQLVGMYSRFGWNHLGPTYFYMLAPIYVLAKERSSSLMWAALVINTIFALFLCLILQKVAKKDVVLATCASLLLALLFLHIGIGRLASPWNPWAIVLPFALFIQASVVFSGGQTVYLPVVLVLGSLLIQTHIGTGPTVLSLTGVSCILYTLARKSRDPDNQYMVLPFAVLIAMWFLPIVQEINGHPGNFSKVVAFFTQSRHSASWTDSLYAVAIQLSWFPLGLLQRCGLGIPDFEYEELARVFAFAQITGLVLVLILATKRGAMLRARMGIIGIVAVLAALWSASRIEGDIFGYLVFWISSIGCMNWALLLAELSEYASKRVCFSIPITQTAVLVISTLLAVVSISFLLKCPIPADSPKIKTLSEELIAYLKVNQIKRPVFLFNWFNWTTDSGLILQLRKKHISFAVQNVWQHHGRDWPLFLGRKYRPSADSKRFIVVERTSSSERPGYHLIGEFKNECVFLKESLEH